MIAAAILICCLAKPELLAQGPHDPLKWRLHVINNQSSFCSAAVFDVDGDGLLDIVSGAFWYEAPDWKRHFVGEVEVIMGRPDGYSHLPYDVNGDGHTDIINLNFRSRSIYWMQHPGPGGGEWTRHVVDVPGRMETGRLYDIDGDGRLDILPCAWDFAAWYEILPELTPGEGPVFVRHDILPEGMGHGNGFGDINGDGRPDYIGINGWAEAPEDPRKGGWIWHPEFELGNTSVPIIVADVDGDGDNDLVYSMGHDYGVFWLEQRQKDGNRVWIKHLVDSTWSQGHSPLWADLDGNGTPEFINGKRFWAHEGRDPGARDPLVIYRYEFDRAKGVFERFTIQENGPAGIGLDPKVIDLDGDGDLDIILPGRSGLFWYENLRY